MLKSETRENIKIYRLYDICIISVNNNNEIYFTNIIYKFLLLSVDFFAFTIPASESVCSNCTTVTMYLTIGIDFACLTYTFQLTEQRYKKKFYVGCTIQLTLQIDEC